MPNVHIRRATLLANGLPLTSQIDDDNEVLKPSDFGLRRADVEATLAVAHEQRTANLIAMLALATKEGWSDDADAVEMRKQIVDHLDLVDTVDLFDVKE